MSTKVVKKMICLPPNVTELADRLGNVSAYIATVLVDRDNEWRAGIAALRSAGWTKKEITGCCRRIGSAWRSLDPLDGADLLALRVDDGCAGAVLAARIKLDKSLARAVWVCAREYDSGNGAFFEALDNKGASK